MKVLSVVFIVLVVAGIVLGIAYPIVCQQHTGKSMGTFDVFAQDVKSLRLGHVTHTSSKKGQTEPPIPLSLSPSMNPIAVVAEITRSTLVVEGAGLKTVFVATLSKDDNTVWQERMLVRPKHKSETKGKGKVSTGTTSVSHNTRAFRSFEIDTEGQFLLQVKPDGENRAGVTAMKVTVKTNVTPPNKELTIIGGIMGVIGILGWLVMLVIQQKQTKQAATA